MGLVLTPDMRTDAQQHKLKSNGPYDYDVIGPLILSLSLIFRRISGSAKQLKPSEVLSMRSHAFCVSGRYPNSKTPGRAALSLPTCPFRLPRLT